MISWAGRTDMATWNSMDLPALSNGYIVDGLETNDPLTNLNSGLSTNLVLGVEFNLRSDCQHSVLFCRSRQVRRVSG